MPSALTAPVLDLDALRVLGEELGDADVLCTFLRRYLEMLDRRIERLERALSVEDRDSWMDAALSLRTSSAMAGAQALSEQVGILQGVLGSPASSAARRCAAEGMARLRRIAAETTRQLRAFLLSVASTAATPSSVS